MTAPNAIDWAEVVDLRARLDHKGWRVVPVWEDIKAPAFAGWPDYRYDPSDPEPPTPRTFNGKGEPTRAEHRGTGVIATGIVAVDLDIDDAARARAARVAFESVADAAPIIRVREGAPRAMLFYGAGDGVKDISASLGADPAKIEIFANHPGRQVMIHGVHPSGTRLSYEGDGPEDWAVADLPRLDRTVLHAAFGAALEAAGIDVSPGGPAVRPGVRRQATPDDATRALAGAFRQVFTGESVHRASNAAADLLAFQLRLDADQTARVLAAVALAAAEVTPAEAGRHSEMVAKAVSRARWYCDRADERPDDPIKARFWDEAAVARFRRAWRLLPAAIQAEFVQALLTRRAA